MAIQEWTYRFPAVEGLSGSGCIITPVLFPQAKSGAKFEVLIGGCGIGDHRTLTAAKQQLTRRVLEGARAELKSHKTSTQRLEKFLKVIGEREDWIEDFRTNKGD